MIGIGTIINALACALGGLAGVFFGHLLSENMQEMLMKSSGVAVIFLGMSGTLQGMLTVSAEGTLATQGSMLLVFSLVLGGIVGEWLDIESAMERVGEYLRRKLKTGQDSRFVEGFVHASLIVCVGAMAIVGPIQDGLTGDYSMLLAKSVLDAVIIMVVAASFGVGACFCALPILVYQGSITLLATLLNQFMTPDMISGLSYIGSALIFCVGLNITFGKKFRVGNMLPAMLVPILVSLWQQFF